MAVEAGLSVYVVGGQGVRLFVVVVSCGVLDVRLPHLSTSSLLLGCGCYDNWCWCCLPIEFLLLELI